MKENEHLIETLREAHKDYGEGRKMDLFAVTLACKEAAAVIERQDELLNRERADRGARPCGRNGCTCEKASFDGYCYQEGCAERMQGETQTRLVDADELKRNVASIGDAHGLRIEEEMEFSESDIIGFIDNAPTVDAEPVPNELKKSVRLIVELYEKAKTLEFVCKPVCYALYHAWRKMDEEAGK